MYESVKKLATLLVVLFAFVMLFSALGFYNTIDITGKSSTPVYGEPGPGPQYCSTDAQCPVDRYLSYYCQGGDVYGNYQDYRCGNFTHRCTSSITPRLVDDCVAGEICVEGQTICQTLQSCTDSDGGLNYTVRGHVYGYNASSGAPYDVWDYCSLSMPSWVVEQYCNGVYPSTAPYNCPYGCLGGACLTAPPSESATYVAPAFNTIRMSFSTHIIDPVGVQYVAGRYNVSFYGYYNWTYPNWALFEDSYRQIHPSSVIGTPYDGTYLFNATYTRYGEPLNHTDCTRGFYIRWKDNNGQLTYVGNTGVLYTSEVEVRSNTIPFAGGC